jgi:hypothetical protein
MVCTKEMELDLWNAAPLLDRSGLNWAQEPVFDS